MGKAGSSGKELGTQVEGREGGDRAEVVGGRSSGRQNACIKGGREARLRAQGQPGGAEGRTQRGSVPE